jgi:hypothetical protein
MASSNSSRTLSPEEVDLACRGFAMELDQCLSYYQGPSANLNEARELREWLRIITREPLTILTSEQKLARSTIEWAGTAGASLTQNSQGLNLEACLRDLLGRINKEVQDKLALLYRKDVINTKELLKSFKEQLIAELGGIPPYQRLLFVNGEKLDENIPVYIEASGAWEYGLGPQR